MDRRTFLVQSTALTAAAVLSPSWLGGMNSRKISADAGLQIYTIRDALAKDFKGSLKRVADLGFKNLELFAYQDGKYFNHSVKEVKSILGDLGLRAKSSHVLTGWSNPEAIGTMTNSWDKTVKDAAELGQEYIVCAYLFESERESLDNYKKLADLLNRCGETAKTAGLQMGYHNHAFEFEKMSGQVPYDILLERCDPDLVKFELDLYWTKRAGVDPVYYFKGYPRRFPLWHVKDMESGEDQFFAAVGEGAIDWQHLFDHSEEAGLKYYFVEQDNTRSGKPFEEIAKSIKYLEGINM